LITILLWKQELELEEETDEDTQENRRNGQPPTRVKIATSFSGI